MQGQVWKFSNDSLATQKKLLLDISDKTVVHADGGMLGVVLHPEYGQIGSPNSEYIYIYYRNSPDPDFDGDFSGAVLSAYLTLS